MGQRDGALSAALADLNGGRVLEAIDSLKQIVRKQTESGPACYYLSRIYTEMAELDVAERYLDRAIAADPKKGPYYYQSGVIRQRQKRWREALTLFDRALNLGVGADEAAVWRSIGNVRAQLFEREGAREAYENSLRIQARDARTHLAFGQFLLEGNDLQKAVAELQATVDLEPRLPGALASLGRAYRRLADWPSAVATLTKALELDSADLESRYGLGQVLLAMGRSEEGRKELEIYRRVDDQVSQADRYFDTATARVAAGELAEAQKLLELSIELAPSYSPALHALGKVLLDREKPQEAASMLRRAAALNPVSAAIHFDFGTAYLRIGNLPEAVEETRRALVLDDENARYHRQLGEIYTRLGRIPEGRDELKTAAELESR